MSWANHTQIKEQHFSCFWQHSAPLNYCLNKCCQGIPMKKHRSKDANPGVKPCKLLLLSNQRSCRTSWTQHLPHTKSCLWWLHFSAPFCSDVWINTKVRPTKQAMLTNGKEVSIETMGFPQTWHKMRGVVLVMRPRPPAPHCCSCCCRRAWLNSGCHICFLCVCGRTERQLWDCSAAGGNVFLLTGKHIWTHEVVKPQGPPTLYECNQRAVEILLLAWPVSSHNPNYSGSLQRLLFCWAAFVTHLLSS